MATDSEVAMDASSPAMASPSSEEDASSHGERNSGEGSLTGEDMIDAKGEELAVQILLDGNYRALRNGPLSAYHRGVAVRMLTDYLKDLDELNAFTSLKDREIVQKRLTDYQAALKDLHDANQLEPNSRLTIPERDLVKKMLRDYLRALEDRLQAPDEPDEEPGTKKMNDRLEFLDDTLRYPGQEDPNNLGRLPDEDVREFEASFPILLEMLSTALKGCDTKMQTLSHLRDQLTVFHLQCTYLVETLSTSTDEKFIRYHETLKSIEGLELEGIAVGDRQDWLRGVEFCIQSLVELDRTFKAAVQLFSMCCAEEWWRTALNISTVRADPNVPRWSTFTLALRQCEWSLDIVELAFHVLSGLLSSNLVSSLDDFSFKWSGEKRRLVLKIRHGESASPQENEVEPARALMVSQELEAKDTSALLQNLDKLAGMIRKWSRPDAQLIAKFLMTKLGGPTPMASYLPYTFRIENFKDLKYKSYIDKGASGMVAKHVWFGNKVAVKSVRAPGLIRQKFEEEAAILATVQHPYVVQLIGCAFNDKKETGMLIMELMEHDLRTVIEKRCPEGSEHPPFPIVVAIDIMLQIAEAMHHLREHKILHRDLKAKNILINHVFKSSAKTLSGEFRSLLQCPHLARLLDVEDYYIVKLADFGLAKCRPQTSRCTTNMAGTTPWRAPEVFTVLDTEVSSKYKWPADVYSFAMTCYEILTGRVPFDSVPQTSIFERILANERPPLGRTVPSHVAQLIHKCWDTNPDRRPDFLEICRTLWNCKAEAILPVFRP